MPAQPTATFVSDEIGDSQDRVAIRLGGDDLLYAESWNWEECILSQPARWSLRLGFQDVALELFKRYPPRTPCELSIMGAVQATGAVDARYLEQRPGAGGQELVIRGRDALAPVHDTYVRAAQAFKDSTYSDMVARALKECGADPSKLVLTNSNNRRLKAGVPLVELAPPQTVNQIAQEVVPGTTLGAVQQELQAKCGERWTEFLRRHLDRAGLMLWAGADGSFILSAPNGRQAPTYSLYRRLTQTSSQTNILGWALGDDATGRHTEVVVYGRGGGRKFGAVKSKGGFIDQEMLDWGYDQPLVLRDIEVQTAAQAEYFARRKLAEERRDGFRLEYTFAGHTLPVSGGNGQQRAVVTTDTTIEVDDELLGIQGVFYIETVRRMRGPQTTTYVRLMRPDDLVFGELSATAAAGNSPPATNSGDVTQDQRDLLDWFLQHPNITP